MYGTASTVNLAAPKWGKLLSLSDNPDIPSIDLNMDSVVLGRGKTAHPLCKKWPDPKKYSSSHCNIALEQDEAGDFSPMLYDTSTNGTFVNGTKVGKGNKVKLANKDCIILVVPALSHPLYTKDKTVAFIFYDYTQEYNPSGAGGIPSTPEKKAAAPAPAPSSPGDSPSAADASPVSSSSPSSNSRVSRLKDSKKKRASKYDLGPRKFVTGSGASSTTVVRSKKKLSPDSEPSEFLNQMKIKSNVPQTYDALATAVEQNDSEWLLSFIDQGGLRSLLQILKQKLTSRTQMYSKKNSVVSAILKVFKKAMNDPEGWKAMLNEQKQHAFGIISLCLDSENMGSVNVRIEAAELLAMAAAVSREGRLAVHSAFDYFQDLQNERLRFTKLCKSLDLVDDVEYKTAVMMLINAIIGTREAIRRLTADDRIPVRSELLKHGLEEKLTMMELENNELLSFQVAQFRRAWDDDKADATVAEVDVTDPVSIAKALHEQLFGTASVLHFREIMKQLLSITAEKPETAAEAWKEAEVIVSEAIGVVCAESQAKSGRPTKARPKKLDVGTLRQMGTMRRGNKPDKSKDKLQSEMKELLEKKQQLEQQLEDTKAALAKEHEEALSNTRKAFEKEIVDLRKEVEELKAQAKNGPVVAAVAGGAVTSAAAAVESSAEPAKVPEAVTPAAPPAAAPAPPPMMMGGPPPPPMMGGPGGPPPPPMMGGGGGGGGAEAQYRYRPKVQMKQLYWKKIPPMKIQGTVWEELDWQAVDLEPQVLEELFGAKKKKSSVAEDKAKKEAEAEENPWQNLVDLKRANNIGIMLSHLKMSPAQIVQAILSLDRAVLTPNVLQQLIKAAPTEEEHQLLSRFDGDPKELGKVERFLLEILKVDRLVERLELFKFSLAFEETVSDLIWNYQTLTNAARQVTSSQSLLKILQIILAMGNFMNFGPYKAPTKGFQMVFLTKLKDTRSSETNMTATHWLIQYLEEHDESVFALPDELRRVNAACKLSSGQLNQDTAEVRNNLAALKRELTRASEAGIPDDKFSDVMMGFSIMAKEKVEELELAKAEFCKAHVELANWMLENPASSVAEELLAIFSDFLMDFEKAKADNEREREQRQYEANIAARKAARKAEKEEAKKNKRPVKKKGGVLDKAGMTLRGKKGMADIIRMQEEEEAAEAAAEAAAAAEGSE